MNQNLYTKLGTMPGEWMDWKGAKPPTSGERRLVRHNRPGEKYLPVIVDRVDVDPANGGIVFCSLL